MMLRAAASRCLCALGLILLAACQPTAGKQIPGMGLAAKPVSAEQPAPEPDLALQQNATALEKTLKDQPPPMVDPLPTNTDLPVERARLTITPSSTAPAEQVTPTTATTNLPAESWKEWPVIPIVPVAMRELYLRGLKEGRRANAFSILGDCQSQPGVFLGLFDSDPDFVATLPEDIQATARQFRGSFNRYSPTVKDGTTEGALLWADWNDNKEKKCQRGETPLECELRVHQPSIVFIHVGTHWEARQERYMRRIIERIIEFGAVPVMVTKADNRELDERVNQNLVKLAVEYQLPVWNFWRSVQDLPNRGMVKDSNMYLNKQGLDVHRIGGIEALDAVWRALK